MIILILISAFLTIMLIFQNEKIKKISGIIEQVEKGNFNQRIRINSINKSTGILCERINNLIDSFQRIVEENKNIEDSRKKMISNISHDLRTPLTSILGYIDVIKTDDSLTEEERVEFLNIVEKKGKALHSLMEEFFQLSKIESDDINININKVNISEIVRETIALFYNEFINLNIEPVINIPEEDFYVLGDGKCINRVLNNLISNSLKYGKDGGIIGISVKENVETIEVQVWDKGKGISEKSLPYIFDRLYTAEDSRNTKFQGSGIGLTICKKLIEKQNGRIEVSSTENEKTVFTFYIPKYFIKSSSSMLH